MTSARFDISAHDGAFTVPAPDDADFELKPVTEGADAGYWLACRADDPFTYFRAHPLRILAACRLASQLGVHIEPGTLQVMKSLKMRLARLEVEAIRNELEGLLLGPFAYDALMECVDVLVAVLPEVAACRGFAQPTPYHIYDVWEHTSWVVQRSPATSLSRWAALLHDIGKPAAGFMDGEVIHFYGHPILSTVLARSVVERLQMDDGLATGILALVRMHDEKIPATEAGVRDALDRLGGDANLFRALCKLKRADALSQSSLSEPRIQLAADLERMLDEVLEDDCGKGASPAGGNAPSCRSQS